MEQELFADDARLLSIMNRRITSRYLNDASADPEMHEVALACQAAFERKDFLLAYRLITRLLLLHRGMQPSENTELATALDFRLDRRLLGPGDSLDLSLVPVFSLEQPLKEKYLATFQVRDLHGHKEESLPQITIREARTYRAPVDTSVLPPGKHVITYKLKNHDGKTLVECRRDFVVDPEARARFAALNERFNRVKQRLADVPPMRERAALQTIEFVLQQMRLALETYSSSMNHRSLPMTVKLRGVDMARYDNDPFDSARDLPLVESLLHDLETGRDPFASRGGDMRLAFRSAIDNTLQPFRVFLPDGWQSRGQLPAVVALHGATGDENTYFDRYLDVGTQQNLFRRLGQSRGFLLASPNGRGPFGGYVGNSEQDVLEVLERVTALFPINRSQVFLTGHSMGGVGTWNIGFRHPELFAALAPVAGRPHDTLAPLLDQAPDKPVFFAAGANDQIVIPAKTAEWANIARQHLRHFEYREYPRDDHFGIGLSSMPDVFDFFEQVRSIAP